MWCDLGRCSQTVVTVVIKLRRTSAFKMRQPPCARTPSGPGGGRRIPFPQGNSEAPGGPAAPQAAPPRRWWWPGRRATCTGLSDHLLLATLARVLMQHELLLLSHGLLPAAAFSGEVVLLPAWNPLDEALCCSRWVSLRQCGGSGASGMALQ